MVKKSQMPSVIEIGATTYSVTTEKDLHATVDDKKIGLNGHILHDEGRIKIEKGLPLTRRRLTLMHEVVHGVLENMGMDTQDEHTVLLLGYGLTDVLRRNPDLVAYIVGE